MESAVTPPRNLQNLGITLRLGWVVARVATLPTLGGGITCAASRPGGVRRASANADSESNFRAALHRCSLCPKHGHDARGKAVRTKVRERRKDII